MRHRLGAMSFWTAVLFTLVACSSGGSGGGNLDQVGTAAVISHIHGLAVDATGAPYVATHNGLIKAAADGSWVYASADTYDYMGFSLHPSDGIMYRSGHSAERPSLGVESSTDGAAWTHLSDVGDQAVDFHAMAVSFADSGTLWGWDYSQGTFRTSDGGETWTRLDPQGIENQIYAFAGSPQANLVFAGTATGLYRSTDAGDTWTAVPGASNGYVVAIAADPNDAQQLVISTPDGLRITHDGGATWASAEEGLPSDIEITSVAISPADSDIAYAADSSTIFRTTDDGGTWSAL